MTERRIVMFNQVSADGYFSDEGGGLDWVVSDPEIHARAAAGMPHTDTILFGRRTYQQFESFWPHALKAAPTRLHGAEPGAAAMRNMAEWINGAKKLVFSRTLSEVGWSGAELAPELTAANLRALKRKPGKDMIIFGSGSIVSALTRHGLIDEYRFVLCPVLLGDGIPLLREVGQQTKVVLKEHVAFRSGNVLLTYEPAR